MAADVKRFEEILRDLRKHMKVHKCNQCDYASVWAWDLKKHKKSHSGGKNVQRQSM